VVYSDPYLLPINEPHSCSHSHKDWVGNLNHHPLSWLVLRQYQHRRNCHTGSSPY
jgi:hypothetical protein